MKKTLIYTLATVFGVAGVAETAPQAQANETQPSVRSLDQLRAKVRSEAMNEMAGGDLQTVGRRGWRGGGRGWRGGGRGWGHRGWGGRRFYGGRRWGGRRYYGGRRFYGGRRYWGPRYYYGGRRWGGRRWCGGRRWRGGYRCYRRGPGFGVRIML